MQRETPQKHYRKRDTCTKLECNERTHRDIRENKTRTNSEGDERTHRSIIGNEIKAQYLECKERTHRDVIGNETHANSRMQREDPQDTYRKRGNKNKKRKQETNNLK